MPGTRIGRILGIEIRLDVSLILIFTLIVLDLALGLLPRWHPDWAVAQTIAVAIAAAVSFLASILLHELAHSLVARAYGVPVSSITLFLFGGVANIESEPRRPMAELLMAIVGPLTSAILGVSFTAAALLVAGPLPAQATAGQIASALGPVATILAWLGPVNLLLAGFNLLPGFPLDGGRVLRAVLWGVTGDLLRATRWSTMVGTALGWAFVGTGIAMALGIRVPVFGTGIVGGLWLALIGMFLGRAARAAYGQMLVQQVLGDIAVERVMTSDVVLVDHELPVDELVERYLVHSDLHTFPVVEGDRLVGVVTVDDVRRLSRSQWANTPVREVMTPRARMVITEPHAPAVDAYRALARSQTEDAPVVREGHVIGLFRSRDIMRWLLLHGRAEPV